jgi:hypothetical protein
MHVVATDSSEKALKVAATNIGAAQVACREGGNAYSGSVQLEPLMWGREETRAFVRRHIGGMGETGEGGNGGREGAFERQEEKETVAGGTVEGTTGTAGIDDADELGFDLILASEVVYSLPLNTPLGVGVGGWAEGQRSMDALAETLAELCRPRTIAEATVAAVAAVATGCVEGFKGMKGLERVGGVEGVRGLERVEGREGVKEGDRGTVCVMCMSPRDRGEDYFFDTAAPRCGLVVEGPMDLSALDLPAEQAECRVLLIHKERS